MRWSTTSSMPWLAYHSSASTWLRSGWSTIVPGTSRVPVLVARDRAGEAVALVPLDLLGAPVGQRDRRAEGVVPPAVGAFLHVEGELEVRLALEVRLLLAAVHRLVGLPVGDPALQGALQRVVRVGRGQRLVGVDGGRHVPDRPAALLAGGDIAAHLAGDGDLLVVHGLDLVGVEVAARAGEDGRRVDVDRGSRRHVARRTTRAAGPGRAGTSPRPSRTREKGEAVRRIRALQGA